MRKIYTLLLFAAVIGLASCGNGGVKITNLLTVPVEDTASKGSYLQITFDNESADSNSNTFSTYNDLPAGYFNVLGTNTETFNIYDLLVNNSPLYALTATTTMDADDSFWTAKVLVTDYTTKLMALNLTVYRDSSTSLGVYGVVVNNSTLTDYSLGENRIYQIGPGSMVTITTSSTLYVAGTLNLNLIYNYQIQSATGSFKIYH